MKNSIWLMHTTAFKPAVMASKEEYLCRMQKKPIPIDEDILKTIENLGPYARFLGTEEYLDHIKRDTIALKNGAQTIRTKYKALKGNVAKLTNFQSELWMNHQNCA